MDISKAEGFETIEYKGGIKNTARCGVLILDDPNSPTVILSELSDNKGISVTNVFEALATTVYLARLTHRDPATIRWIEHCPPGCGIERLDTFNDVVLKYSLPDGYYDPIWQRISVDDLSDLPIGMTA